MKALLPVSLASLVFMIPPALARQDARSRLLPITVPIRRAGVFHVGTGTWTRGGQHAALIGPDVIYNNTCSPSYITTQLPGELFQHQSVVPSPAHPTVPSQCGVSSNDEAPGCNSRYVVDGFEFSYCSSATSTIDYRHEFASCYSSCGTNMVPDVSFVITGLPGGTPGGTQNCWIVDIDLDAGGSSFVLAGDGDGSYGGCDTFGWSFGIANASVPPHTTGPTVAGNFAPAGCGVCCSGTDGTIWDSPIDLTESGTGMGSADFFRDTGPVVSAPSGPGCYYFGGCPHADFYLKLFSYTGCTDPLVSFCDPGAAGVVACPCGNAPSGPDRGCNNFGAATGGATLTGAGVASVSADTFVLTCRDEDPSAFSAVLQGTAAIATGTGFGAGVRCVGGTLKRMYTGSASSGAFQRPRAGDPSVSQRSAALGDPIQPGQHRYYLVYYRDPLAAGPCADPAKTFNASQSGNLAWGP